ncbi:MAG: DUF975 family protein [Acutalibacteraceae bacterium]
MINRSKLKKNAKRALKAQFGTAVVISFITYWFTGGTGSLGGLNFIRSLPSETALSGEASRLNPFISLKDQIMNNSGFSTGFYIGTTLLILLAVVGSLSFTAFVSGPVTVGNRRFYLMNRLGGGDFKTLFSAFKPGYFNVVKGVFIKTVYIFLWTFLFIIPGIVKSFEYSLVEFILAENPNLSPHEALDLSSRMTDGKKGEILIFQLSFIGWLLTIAMTCGISLFFLRPYVEASWAELYTALRENAILNGTVEYKELCPDPVP